MMKAQTSYWHELFALQDMLEDAQETDIHSIAKFIKINFKQNDWREIVALIHILSCCNITKELIYVKILQELIFEQYFDYYKYFKEGFSPKNPRVVYHLYKLGVFSKNEIIQMCQGKNSEMSIYFPFLRLGFDDAILTSNDIAYLEYEIENFYPKGSFGEVIVNDNVDLFYNGGNYYSRFFPFPVVSNQIDAIQAAAIFNADKIFARIRSQIQSFSLNNPNYTRMLAKTSNASILNHLQNSNIYQALIGNHKIKNFIIDDNNIIQFLEESIFSLNYRAFHYYMKLVKEKNIQIPADVTKYVFQNDSVSLFRELKFLIQYNSFILSAKYAAYNIFLECLNDKRNYLNYDKVMNNAIKSNSSDIMKYTEKYGVQINHSHISYAVAANNTIAAKKALKSCLINIKYPEKIIIAAVEDAIEKGSNDVLKVLLESRDIRQELQEGLHFDKALRNNNRMAALMLAPIVRAKVLHPFKNGFDFAIRMKDDELYTLLVKNSRNRPSLNKHLDFCRAQYLTNEPKLYLLSRCVE